jgi:hypothetical protein
MMVGAMVIAGTLAGCGPRGDRSGTGDSRPRPRSTATIAFLEPLPGRTISGATVQVHLALTGGVVVLQTSMNLVPNEGHIHLKLDGKLISMTAGLDQQVPVTKGPHILEAEFAANDHLPFDPRVVTTLPFIAQ